MGKIQFKQIRVSLYPTCAVVVTAKNNKESVGAATIAWNGILSSQPCVLGVSFLPDSFTRSCIFETRDFVVNVPDKRYCKETNYLGSLSASWDEKMTRAPPDIRRLTLMPSSRVRSPRIEEFYINLECRMLNSIQIGLYDCILGEVLTMHASSDAYLTDHPKGNVLHEQFQPILCLGDQYWSDGMYFGISNANKKHPHGNEH
jgi:flavin reductase (DIM6/NTAB) family NADH-FMN oxidoreductase RutF